jgi:hypothetical protein
MAEFTSARSGIDANPQMLKPTDRWAEPPIMEEKNGEPREELGSSPGLSFPYTRRFNPARNP